MWPGFEPDDFVAFQRPDVISRIDYLKARLHPRLRTLGEEIARRLSIEVSTVKNHVHNILEKLQVTRRGEAAARVRIVAPAHGSGIEGSMSA